jgi:hypothetical protein
MWEPLPLTTLWAFTACYRDSFHGMAKEKCRVCKLIYLWFAGSVSQHWRCSYSESNTSQLHHRDRFETSQKLYFYCGSSLRYRITGSSTVITCFRYIHNNGICSWQGKEQLELSGKLHSPAILSWLNDHRFYPRIPTSLCECLSSSKFHVFLKQKS